MADLKPENSISLTWRVGRLHVLLAAVICLGIASAVSAQNVIDDNIAPPPLRLMSQAEKDKLGSEIDVKRRTKLALELMDARLKQAEALNTAGNYDQMFLEFGAFHGLMDNMLEFLNSSDKDSGKVLNNFKRFEIGLRLFTPRLEVVRRNLPIRYEHYVRILIKNLRAARSKAIEPLFDDSVVPTKKKPSDSANN
ncbi:MAG TPA: hypothetical protein VFZ23_07495 [Pyrinomonadaceae bacterium]